MKIKSVLTFSASMLIFLLNTPLSLAQQRGLEKLDKEIHTYKAYCFTDWAECEIFFEDKFIFTRILPAKERSEYSRKHNYTHLYESLSDGSAIFALHKSNIRKAEWSSHCSTLDNYSLTFSKVVGDCSKTSLTIEVQLLSSRVPKTRFTPELKIEDDGAVLWHLEKGQNRTNFIKDLQNMIQSN